jgi:hypothetical protein
MKTLIDYIEKSKTSAENRKIWVAQFVDDFNRTKNLKMIEDEIKLSDDSISKLFEAIAHQLCLDLKLQTPEWLLNAKYLNDPFFVSDLPNSRFLALRDSPYAFRSRNIFVPYHYLSRT